ncbi:carbohydrate ABC transporter substrate-binding protein, partial [Rhizobium leguminosarum]
GRGAAAHCRPAPDRPPNKDPLVNVDVETMKTVQGKSQYYDRESDPDMAQAGLVGFQELMAKPDRRKAILTRLEGTRKRIYKI